MSEYSPEMDLTPGKPLRVYQQDGAWSDLSTDEIVGKRLNNFKGWLCAMGVRNLFVDMDGDVYGATCRVLGKLGNVFASFSIPQGWVTCPSPLCTCGADLFVPKAKAESELRQLRKTSGQPTDKNQRRDSIGEYVAIERTHASQEKQIYWEIGRRCNYDCSYCSPYIHNKTDAHRTREELLGATERLLQQFAGSDKVNFIISGGEPTINPDFLEWVQYISGLGHTLSMHSNGSRLPDYYRELIHYGNLNLSAHFEFFKADRFVQVVEAITAEKVRVGNHGVGHLEVKLMMTPGRREEALSLMARLKEIPHFTGYCTWAFVPVRDLKNGDVVMQGYEPADELLFGAGQV